MGVDLKYGVAVTDVEGHSPVGDDEPIFIFRAKDANAIAAIESYGKICIEQGTSPAHVDEIARSLDAFRSWQEQNKDKVGLPD